MHSDSVLSRYYNCCKDGKDVPFVPVIRKEVVKPYLDSKFEEFERRHPEAEFFMLDGSHRTTALTLAGCKIEAIVYESDADIDEAKAMVPSGKILQNGSLDHNLEGNCEILNKHFQAKPYFMTVKEKTEKMVDEKMLPEDCS